MEKSLLLKILLCVVICIVIGSLSGITTGNSINTWYATLNKPSFNPPNWIFGPMWTLLYILMGVSVALVWHSGLSNLLVRSAIYLFVTQLILNAFWSITFFGMQNPLLALVNIIVLLILIVTCIFYFKRINKLAAWLLVPYLLWVSFATLLNLSIVILN